jgi:putative DNA methylase
MTYKKKLIEVAIPLEKINEASAREKSIRHGHPSTLHLWWARRPLAACRAVLFAQLVDDPSGHVDDLLSDAGTRTAAELELNARLGDREKRRQEGKALPADDKEITVEDVAIELERKRLFDIIEELVIWENSTNEEVLERARAEIRRSCGGELPPVYDPFSGGGSIPLEAQRLGLPAYGSDLNPVAVMIGKAMIEIPPKFKDMPPIHPGIKDRNHYRNAEGLAEDLKYYGEWMREKAWERIGHLYPQVRLPKESGGSKATVIAWIWARTVPSPDPAFSDVHVPIASSFLLSSKKSDEAWLEPIVDKARKAISYRIRRGGTNAELERAAAGTKAGRGANFVCLLSGTAITPGYVKEKGKAGEMGETLIAVLAEGNHQRVYVGPSDEQEQTALSAQPSWKPEIRLPNHSQYVGVLGYGFKTFGDLFTNRQLVALNTFSDLISEVREKIERDTLDAGFVESSQPLDENGTGSKAYAEAVSLYLAFAIDRVADYGSSIATWAPGGFIRSTFSRQAIQMTWDYGECNFFSDSTGNFIGATDWISKALCGLPSAFAGTIRQIDAQSVDYPANTVISTDPPYYDNIPYADISDFFYAWLRRSVGNKFSSAMSTLVVPKQEELVADRMRHGSAENADRFFLDGMRTAMNRMVLGSQNDAPATIYYAFKQSDLAEGGVSSTGWATFLTAVVEAGYSVCGTWPMRTERPGRMRAVGANALANSVVLVCRKKETDAGVVSRAEFIRALKRELPEALRELLAANIAPSDIPQASIGPGMGIFSRHSAVLESDDTPMSVKSALQLINREVDEYLNDVVGEFDSDTRLAITWFEQFGLAAGPYGTADNIARGRGVSVESAKHAGILESSAGNVRILKRDELPKDWNPAEDKHLTVWECCQQVVRALETGGEFEAAALIRAIGPTMAENVKDLAYCLYNICEKRKDAKEATSYNALIAVWSDLTRLAASSETASRGGQFSLAV